MTKFQRPPESALNTHEETHDYRYEEVIARQREEIAALREYVDFIEAPAYLVADEVPAWKRRCKELRAKIGRSEEGKWEGA